MRSRKKHVILFLLDSVKMGPPQTDQMERYLQRIKKPANSEIDIYFLKIMTVEPGPENLFKDVVMRVVFSEICNQLKVVGNDKYNLRSEEGLRKCFNAIRDSSVREVFYLISCGHGSGFYLNRRYLKDAFGTEKSVSNKIVFDNEEYIAMIPEIQNDAIPWNEETIWNIELSKACSDIKPEIGIFNNCYVNFFDSLIFYSDSFKYIISSEKYQCTSMLILDKLIDEIIAVAELPEKERVEKIYEVALQGVTLGRHAAKCHFPSLVLLKLKEINEVLALLNTLFLTCVGHKGFSIDQFKELQKNLDKRYLTNDYWQVELFELLTGIVCISESSTLIEMGSDISSFAMKEIVMRYESFSDSSDPCSGISIYLPKYKSDYFHHNIFLDYKKEMERRKINLSEQFRWYALLDKMEKLM